MFFKWIPPLFFLIFLSLPSSGNCRTSESLKVKLQHGGVLVGRHLTTIKGRHMRAFMGIPYAKPPVGELRFMPPVPAPSWSGEKHVVQDSPLCIQRDPYRRDDVIEGSEDCLYLNVYTPPLADIQKERMPVMVWFHGGGWQCGSGISAFYGPDHLLDHNVIYVSGNFRLGALGFLSTETKDCPGNNGMKDQVAILKWVKENIAKFGGNPDDVTIFGESAGGASVTYHMLSKVTKGLFHKAISQSGTYHNPWAQPPHKGVAAARAKKLAELLNCSPDKGWSKALDCMRKHPADVVTSKLYDFFEWDTDPMIPFPPVVEPVHEGAFLTVNPRETKESPHGLSIPWMAGSTSGEGVLKTASILNMPELLADLKENYEKALPIILNYDHHSKEKQNEITEEIEQFYFAGGHNYHKEDHQNFTDLISDAWFIAGIDEYIKERLNNPNKNSVGPTYLYLFDHKGASSFTEIFKGGREDFYAVCHAEELQYLFPVGKSLFVSAIPTEEDIAIREALLEMWVNFAKFGNPTPAGSQLLKWEPATSTHPLKYVKIGSTDHKNWKLLTNEENLYKERTEFWGRIQPHLDVDKRKDEL